VQRARSRVNRASHQTDTFAQRTECWLLLLEFKLRPQITTTESTSEVFVNEYVRPPILKVSCKLQDPLDSLIGRDFTGTSLVTSLSLEN